ncbi:MAG: DUF4266 domain-containing protein [Granulosicoccus sp.]
MILPSAIPIMTKRAFTALLIASSMLLSGCVSLGNALSYKEVRAWEKGALAQDGMQPVLDSMDQSVDDHIYFSREGSTGGSSVRGGGCGCN